MTTFMTSESAPSISEWMASDFAKSFAQQREKMESDGADEQQRLTARALQGDENAFEEILERYKRLMLRTAYSIVKDQDIAEDAVQNALIQAWQHLPSLRETGALRSWLMCIVVNQCISFKRRFARSTLFLQQAFAEQETERASQIANYAEGIIEGTWDLVRAIEELPAKQQTVIALHYYQGMTLPEMSQTLQTSENTLKKRIQAALSNLRRVLRKAETDEARFSPGLQSPGGS
jgi:RNA polymerase sigma-70 factor, ECF subfamily